MGWTIPHEAPARTSLASLVERPCRYGLLWLRCDCREPPDADSHLPLGMGILGGSLIAAGIVLGRRMGGVIPGVTLGFVVERFQRKEKGANDRSETGS